MLTERRFGRCAGLSAVALCLMLAALSTFAEDEPEKADTEPGVFKLLASGLTNKPAILMGRITSKPGKGATAGVKCPDTEGTMVGQFYSSRSTQIAFCTIPKAGAKDRVSMIVDFNLNNDLTDDASHDVKVHTSVTEAEWADIAATIRGVKRSFSVKAAEHPRCILYVVLACNDLLTGTLRIDDQEIPAYVVDNNFDNKLSYNDRLYLDKNKDNRLDVRSGDVTFFLNEQSSVAGKDGFFSLKISEDGSKLSCTPYAGELCTIKVDVSKVIDPSEAILEFATSQAFGERFTKQMPAERFSVSIPAISYPHVSIGIKKGEQSSTVYQRNLDIKDKKELTLVVEKPVSSLSVACKNRRLTVGQRITGSAGFRYGLARGKTGPLVEVLAEGQKGPIVQGNMKYG